MSRLKRLAPGFVVSATVAMAATFLSEHYGAPVMLFALLLGMAFNFLAQDDKCRDGVAFTLSWILRVGVALLGTRSPPMRCSGSAMARCCSPSWAFP